MDKTKTNLPVLILPVVLGMICAAAATPHSLPQSEFECPENWGYYEDPENCIKYYNCEFGVPESITCRSEQGIQLLYDHKHNYCDWPERVNCGKRPICDINNKNCHEQDGTTPEYETTTETDHVTTDDDDENGFECPEEWGYFADPKNCIKYYVCSAGISERTTCREENGIQLHYNEENVWCDWPEKVNCGNRPVCDINDENCDGNNEPTEKHVSTDKHKPTENPPVPTDSPVIVTCESLGHCSTKEEGDLKPLGPCEACFCECSHQSYTQLCCPAGLVFNPEKNMCDWQNKTPGCH